MPKHEISIEIFCAPNCNRCGKAVELVKQIAEEMDNTNIQWQKLNVVDNIDYAVALGVRATPAIAINGKLEFTATPSPITLKNKLKDMLR